MRRTAITLVAALADADRSTDRHLNYREVQRSTIQNQAATIKAKSAGEIIRCRPGDLRVVHLLAKQRSMARSLTVAAIENAVLFSPTVQQ